MTEAEEDAIIKQADVIKHRIFAEAEKKWAETPRDQKMRAWPRCGDITCNRTMVCQARSGNRCSGFDY